jgi:hypothetical protein
MTERTDTPTPPLHEVEAGQPRLIRPDRPSERPLDPAEEAMRQNPNLSPPIHPKPN